MSLKENLAKGRLHDYTQYDLLLLLKLNAAQILRELNQSNSGFVHFLKNRIYRKHDCEKDLEIIVKILRKVCTLRQQGNPKNLDKLLLMLRNCEEFLYTNVPYAIYYSLSGVSKTNPVSFLADYMYILATLLQTDLFPCDRIVNEIFPAIKGFMLRLRVNSSSDLSSVEVGFKDLVSKLEEYQNPISNQRQDDKEMGNFRELSITPRENDILNYQILFIPHNIIDRPYKSVDHYLSVHYRLTREDMLRSFRECVKIFTGSGCTSANVNKNNFFEKVSLVSPPKYTIEGICYNVKVESSKEIDWAKNEALLPGSLVILTLNSFKSVFVGIIKNIPKVSYNKSKECQKIIQFENDGFFRELSPQEYQMVQPAAYFECYKHVLTAIKDFTEFSFPLSKILAYLEFYDLEPRYLQGKKYCLHEKCGGVSAHNYTHSCKIFNPLNEDEWPALEELDELKLDKQQYGAFKTALTKKVAVIQGPPGTGKTYVGLKIVQTLLENGIHRPIVICCFSNHALDHFLEGILRLTKHIVRLGSQSKDETLKPYQIDNLVHKSRMSRQRASSREEAVLPGSEYYIKEYKNAISTSRPVDFERLEIVKNSVIIGVTTTGACKYKDLIGLSEPHVMIVEEAAQVLESHVIASLVPSIQHLILIGDHEQLRPLPADHELSEKYNLKISMFERLFRNGAPSCTLVSQHRMKPCIAELLVPLPYAQYTSDKKVYEYEEIRGVQSSVYFFNHNEFEDRSCQTSLSNEFEAKMVVSLAKYFCTQAYLLEKLTIIATYAAQVALIRRYLSEDDLPIHVTTVDNFQGEENDIIIVSFVRSNPSTIGFLKESNRVCVALSRAKKGLFCFGNFNLFCRRNKFWKNIVKKVQSEKMIGDYLMLKCEHESIYPVKCQEDIERFIDSGCSQTKCNVLLSCMHRCDRICHFKNSYHLCYNCPFSLKRLFVIVVVFSSLFYCGHKKVTRWEMLLAVPNKLDVFVVLSSLLYLLFCLISVL